MRLSEEKTEKVFNSLSRMKLLTQIMDFEYNMEMPDVARSPLVRNHISRIKQSISEINTNLSHVLKIETELFGKVEIQFDSACFRLLPEADLSELKQLL